MDERDETHPPLPPGVVTAAEAAAKVMDRLRRGPVAAPCAVCLTTGGRVSFGSRRPDRTSLARFGLDGSACSACYSTVRYRHLRGADPATGLPRKRPWEVDGDAAVTTKGPSMSDLAEKLSGVKICGGNGTTAYFDDMAWPRADNTTGNVEYALRHGDAPHRPEDVMVAASVIAAYRELVWCPRSKREAVVRRLRQVARLFPCPES